MDADFSHDPKDAASPYAACAEGGADMSVGSRYVKGGKVSDWSWDRVLLSYTASLYVRIPAKINVAQFRCITLRLKQTRICLVQHPKSSVE